MYCSHCGKEWKENDIYCGGCGSPRTLNESVNISQSVVPAQTTESIQAQDNKKRGFSVWAIVLIVLGVVILLGIIGFVFFCYIVFSTLENENNYIYEQTENYVYLDGDEVPSLYYFMGEYELCDVPSYDYYDGENTLTYSYCDDYFDEYIMDEYLDYLVDDYEFKEYENTSSSRSVIIASNEEGYYLVVKAYIYGESIEYYKISEDMYNEDNSI